MDPDKLFNGMLRGFAYGTGRRLAYRAPLWLSVIVIVGLYLLKHS